LVVLFEVIVLVLESVGLWHVDVHVAHVTHRRGAVPVDAVAFR
jgi:hypothetical protein